MLNSIQQNDEAIDLARYKQAAEEIEAGKKDDALWYKAFAEASGNEQATKAVYIRLRVDQLRRAAVATAAERTTSTQVAPAARQPPPSVTEPNPLGQRDLYRAYLGEKNADYYLKKFEAFDQKGGDLHAGWNWPAFLFVVWELYRKLYGWFFALLVTYSVLNLLPGSWSLLMLIPWIGFAIFANSLYHNQVKKKIAAIQSVARSNDELLQLLRHKGGVHSWVIWAFLTVFVFGILAAVLIPAISEKSKSRPVAEQPAVAMAAPQSPTLADQLLSEGWTQESTGSTEVGPWLNYSPPRTRYCRYADRTIYRVYPPGVMPNAEKANPFCVGDSTEYVPR